MNSQQRGLAQVGRASYSPKSCDFPVSPFLASGTPVGGPGGGGGPPVVPISVGATGSPASVSIPVHLKAHHLPPEPPLHQASPSGAAHSSIGHHFHHAPAPHNRLMTGPPTRSSPLAVNHGVEASLDAPPGAGAKSGPGLNFGAGPPVELLPGMTLGGGEWGGERQRELEEARARTTQMEKTMRWWSDCTANWREKWAKVRNERNKAREEVRALRHALDKSRRELEEFRTRRAENGRQEQAGLIDGDGLLSPAPSNGHGEASNNTDDSVAGNKRISLTCSESSNMSGKGEEALRARLASEREEKARLLRSLEQLQAELTQASRNKADPRAADEAGQVEELRRELERLQQENAAEWAHRDRLESEKLALEREARRLRSRLDEVEKASVTSGPRDASCSPSVPSSQSPGPGSARNSMEADAAYRLLLQEHEEKDKEANELRRVCARQRRQLEEMAGELEHANRRIDQYEAEVRKLRARIDVLKRDLTLVENELDTQTTACRRMCRSNEELTQQLTSLQVQLDHVHNRYQPESESPRRCQSESDKDPRAGIPYFPQSSQMLQRCEDPEEEEEEEECLRLPSTVLIDNQGLREDSHVLSDPADHLGPFLGLSDDLSRDASEVAFDAEDRDSSG